MSKVKVIDKKSIKSINSERELLSKLYHPFIVNMHYAFQDNKYLYLVMDLLPGGDLRYHISIHKKFSEEQTRFFICGIILSLEYIHSNNIIHRDIKPENLVLDENGYIRLTDFGIAKINMKDNSSETSGTPGYMSPEVIKSLNHSFPTDFFAIGVIGYEFLKGERPYIGKNRKDIKEEMISRQAEIKNDEIKNGNWSKESIDFINKLLIRKPEDRLGFKNGVNELKEHNWLRYYPWDLIKTKKLPSPFVPQNKDNFDSKYCKAIEYIGEDTKARYEEILADDNFEFYFKNFYYNIDEDKNRNKNYDLLLSYKNEKKKSNNKNKKEHNNTNNNSKDKSHNNIHQINKIYKVFNKINSPNNINKKNINYNYNKIKEKHIKLKSDNSNLILINFNISNITNNNINKNKINNFFINKNNNRSEKLKKLIKKTNISTQRSKGKNNSNLGLKDISINNNIYSHSPLNSSIKLKKKNITNNTNNSKSKSKNKDDKKYNYNSSLVKKLTKINLVQVRLLKNKNKNNKNNNLSFGKFMTKTNSQIFSISCSNRENKNKNINTISLNDGVNVNNSRKINKKNIGIKFKLKNESIKNITSIKNIKSKKIIFDKKIMTNKNNDSQKHKKIFKSNIPIKSYQGKEKEKYLKNKTKIYKNILNIFKNNKKHIFSYKKRYPSNNNKINNENINYNNNSINLDKVKLIGNNSQRIKNQKTFFSDL